MAYIHKPEAREKTASLLILNPLVWKMVLLPCDDEEDTSERHLTLTIWRKSQWRGISRLSIVPHYIDCLNEYYHTSPCNTNSKINNELLGVSIKDFFHPQQNVIGARLSHYNNNQKPNTFCSMTCYASATLVVYNYPKVKDFNWGKWNGKWQMCPA